MELYYSNYDSVKVRVPQKVFSPRGRAVVSMMCPGISYSTVHSLIFHTNGSVQNNKLFQEFCNKKQAHFVYFGETHRFTDEMIDSETLTLIDQPQLEKYIDTETAITGEYEVITTFMKIHNISATFGVNSSYQPAVGSYWCMEGGGLECCPPM